MSSQHASNQRNGKSFPKHPNYAQPSKKPAYVELTEENYVQLAEEVIRALKTDKGDKKIVTTSKIRKLLAMMSEIYMLAKHHKGDVLPKEILAKIQYFKMHFIYEAGRGKSTKDWTVAELLEYAYIIKRIDTIKTDKAKLILFCHFMEALVAYRKFLVENDQ